MVGCGVDKGIGIAAAKDQIRTCAVVNAIGARAARHDVGLGAASVGDGRSGLNTRA